MAQGYGIVPKIAMRDTNLSIESKAIYAYLCSFAGAGRTAFPSRELICHELNISINRFNKYKNELVEKGYISIKRDRLENGFSKNIYTLLQNLSIHFVDIRNEDIGIEDIQSVDIGNEYTNINSLNINNLNNNILKSNNNRLSNNKPSKKALLDRFNSIWSEYPNKKGKENAFKAYQKAINNGVTDDVILDGIRRYKQEIETKKTDKQYIA